MPPAKARQGLPTRDPQEPTGLRAQPDSPIPQKAGYLQADQVLEGEAGILNGWAGRPTISTQNVHTN